MFVSGTVKLSGAHTHFQSGMFEDCLLCLLYCPINNIDEIHLSFFRWSYFILLTGWESVQLGEKSKTYSKSLY